MAKVSKASGRFTPEQVQLFLQKGEIKTMADVQSALKDLFGQTLQAMLEGEMDHHLGYEKNSRLELLNRDDPDETVVNQEGSTASNRRNGHGAKSVRSEYVHTLVNTATLRCRCREIARAVLSR